MERIHPYFRDSLPLVIELFKRHEVENAYLFGSVLTDRFKEDSDVDFIVNFKEHLEPLEKGEHIMNLSIALQDALNRNVDMISDKKLKNPYFIESINKTKHLIYES